MFSFTTIFSYLAISFILSYSRMTGIGGDRKNFGVRLSHFLIKSLHIFEPQFPHFSKWTKQCRSPQEDRMRKCAFSESFQGFFFFYYYCHYWNFLQHRLLWERCIVQRDSTIPIWGYFKFSKIVCEYNIILYWIHMQYISMYLIPLTALHNVNTQ